MAISTCSLLRCDGSSIWLYDADTDELFTTVVIKSGSIRVPAKSGIVRGRRLSPTASSPWMMRMLTNAFNPSSDLAHRVCHPHADGHAGWWISMANPSV